ncbi:tetratricopeptide repeat protein [Patescibacteria group bacterium]
MNQEASTKKPIDSIIEGVVSWTLTVLAFLLPIFFLPTTANFYDPNKYLLVIIATFIVTLAWSVKVILNKNARFTSSPFTLPLFLLALVYLISALISQPNRVEAFMGRGLLIPLLTLLFIASTSVLSSRKVVNKVLYASIGSATLLSFVAIFQSIGGSVSSLLNSAWGTTIPETLAFSPAGSPLALLTYIIPVFLASLLIAFTRNEGVEKIALFLLSAVMLGAIVTNSLFVAPGKDNSPVILPFSTGYSIALETLKQPLKTALFGYGPEGYLNAFTKIRPAATNQAETWNLRFTTSSNELFTIITTVGALGMIAWVLLVRRIAVSFSKPSATIELKIIKLVTMALVLMQLLLPTNLVLLASTFLFLTLWVVEIKARSSRAIKDISLGLMEATKLRPSEAQDLDGEKLNQSKFISYAFVIPLIVTVVAVSYFTQRAYAAETMFRKSLVAAAANDGTGTYELQRQAISKNPYVGGYHRTYAVTNLQLASAIAAQGDEISDQDRSNIAQLIQQAIREAKAAVSLDPQKTANWETLANVYRNLINVADNAEQWTVASYVQAISTDPLNPRLRLELGGIYYRLGQMDQAIRLFQQATELKPDWANAYYNLSAAYKEKGELQNALANMQVAVSLVEPDSADATRAQEELESLRQILNIDAPEGEEAPAQGQLNEPQPLPEPIQEPIELPEDSGPNNTEVDVQTQTQEAPEPNPEQ